MDIRAAVPGDVGAVQRVARRAWHEAHGEIIGEEAVEALLEKWYGKAQLLDAIEREDAPMFVAIDDGDDVVAFAQGGSSDDGPADAIVTRIYVLPAYWGEGIGTTLLQRLFDELRQAGYDRVWLAVMAENDLARSFYDAHGFDRHEKRTVDLVGQSVDDLVLVREL